MVRRWARPRPEVLQADDQIWAQLVLRDGVSASDGSKSQIASAQVVSSSGVEAPPFVLGVHMRGTDKYLREPVAPASYFSMIDAAIGWYERAQPPLQRRRVRILLATDDDSFQRSVFARYGRERVRVQHEGALLRAAQHEAVWMLNPNELEAAHQRSVQQPTATEQTQPQPELPQLPTSLVHRRGLEVLIDTLLLSRCDFLLKSASAVSEFAIYFSPRLALASYDFQIPGAPFPSWASGPVLGPGSRPFVPIIAGVASPLNARQWLSHQSSWTSSAELSTRLHPRCNASVTSSPAGHDVSPPEPGRRRLLLHGLIGLYGNQIRCLANAIGFSARLGATLVLDERWTRFASALLDVDWLRATAGPTVQLHQPELEAPSASLSCHDAFWCGGPCGEPADPSEPAASSGLEEAWGITTFEWQAARANGQNHLYSGVAAYPWGGEGEPSMCGYAMLRPHPQAWAKALQSATALWGEQDDRPIAGHHQRLQTSVPAAVGAMCNESARAILYHLGSSAREGGGGSTTSSAAATRFYQAVCAAQASPQMLLDASASALGHAAKRIFLATDGFVESVSATWQQHDAVDSRQTRSMMGSASGGGSTGPQHTDPKLQALGAALLDRLWCNSCSPEQARISASELQQAAAPVLLDALLLVAADDFWPTPGSTFSEAVCYWRVAWGRERPPHITSCEQIVRGWGTSYKTLWEVPKFRAPRKAGVSVPQANVAFPKRGPPGDTPAAMEANQGKGSSKAKLKWKDSIRAGYV